MQPQLPVPPRIVLNEFFSNPTVPAEYMYPGEGLAPPPGMSIAGAGAIPRPPRASPPLSSTLLSNMGVLVSPTLAYLAQPIQSGSVSTSELINPSSNRPRRPLLPPDDPREVTNKEKYGLAAVVAHTSAQAGFDLTSLGLNLNTAANIFRSLVSPWNLDEASQIKVAKHEVSVPGSFLLKTANLEPGSTIPAEFKVKPEQVRSFPPETLFYCYYHFPQDALQLSAAQELSTRGWKVHRDSKLWMTTSPAGSKDWVYFDPAEWQTKPVTSEQGSTDAQHFLAPRKV